MNQQALKNPVFIQKIGRAMREVVDGRVFAMVRNCSGARALTVARTGLDGFQFLDSQNRNITTMVIGVLRNHGDVADAAPQKLLAGHR